MFSFGYSSCSTTIYLNGISTSCAADRKNSILRNRVVEQIGIFQSKWLPMVYVYTPQGNTRVVTLKIRIVDLVHWFPAARARNIFQWHGTWTPLKFCSLILHANNRCRYKTREEEKWRRVDVIKSINHAKIQPVMTHWRSAWLC